MNAAASTSERPDRIDCRSRRPTLWQESWLWPFRTQTNTSGPIDFTHLSEPNRDEPVDVNCCVAMSCIVRGRARGRRCPASPPNPSRPSQAADLNRQVDLYVQSFVTALADAGEYMKKAAAS